MKTLRYFLLFSIVTAFLVTSCESLEVENLNDPDFETAFSNPSDVKGVAGSLINTWFLTMNAYDGISLGLLVAADANTCSWGNAGMRDLSYEPRIAWDNTPAYSNANVTETTYKWLYAGLASSNEVLVKVVVGDMVIKTEAGTDETPMVAAVAHLAQGLNLGFIGLLYDKGYISTENTDLTQTQEVYPWNQAIDTAVMCLDKAIAICESNTFTLPDTWVPGMTMTNVKLAELANTVAAALLSYSPRNKTQDNAVNWGKVGAYASKGLTYDFTPVMDAIAWYSLYVGYGHYGGWGQTDMRLVNMMDPRFPSRWTDAGTWLTLPTPVTTHTAGIDDRIFTDFQYLSTCPFRVERGYYHFSSYRFKRYDDYLATDIGPLPNFTKAENDMLKAEALLHQPDLTAAAAIINAGTRVTRGGLAPVAATAADVEAAIFHERFIELLTSSPGIEFFVMRKANKLQAGTPLHFPIPGQQLEVNQMENYTFGPGKGVAGEDYSNGGWF